MAHERIDGTPVIEPRDPAHPRPWLRRDGWTCLEGTWDFALDADAALTSPAEVDFGSRIVVPFAPETPASGVGFDGFLRRCWYRKRVAVPDLADGERLLVHFGAVDRIATVWADGSQVAHHVGGHTGFSADITDAATIASEGYVELIVRADDDPRRMDVPRGKQDWAAEPHMIWYPRTTGIWQTVWMEVVPATLITDLRWTGDPTDMTVSVEVTVEGDPVAGDHLTILLAVHDRRLVEDCVTITEVTDGRAQVVRSMRVGTPGVDDPFALIWRPGTPTLIDARITYRPAGRGHGTSGIDTDHTVDTVDSYTAIRSVEVTDGRVCLNGRPTRLMLALDQGYWPDSGMTAPSLDALQHDVDMIRSLGLSGVRKHQKVEDPRWLAMCDEAGLLVWAEMPSAFAWSSDLPATLAAEWTGVVLRDRNHPCIVAWVPMNESWGAPDLAGSEAQRQMVHSLGALTNALDPTRPVVANDGWETIDGQIVGIHDYSQDPGEIARRYGDAASLDTTIRGRGPAMRRLTADGSGRDGRAVLLSEFGGCTLAETAEGTFGYGDVADPEQWLARIAGLCSAALGSDELSGYCWTQLTDTYQERNGLLRADRTPKAELERIVTALWGVPPNPPDDAG